jgi:hypothetical protein
MSVDSIFYPYDFRLRFMRVTLSQSLCQRKLESVGMSASRRHVAAVTYTGITPAF